MPAQGLSRCETAPEVMKFGRPCVKCGSPQIMGFRSVRAGGGPLAVGQILADAFTYVSQFEAYVCQNCGYTELYRTIR